MMTIPEKNGDPEHDLRLELEEKYFSELGTFTRSIIQEKLDLLWQLSLERVDYILRDVTKEYDKLVRLVL